MRLLGRSLPANLANGPGFTNALPQRIRIPHPLAGRQGNAEGVSGTHQRSHDAGLLETAVMSESGMGPLTTNINDLITN